MLIHFLFIIYDNMGLSINNISLESQNTTFPKYHFPKMSLSQNPTFPISHFPKISLSQHISTKSHFLKTPLSKSHFLKPHFLKIPLSQNHTFPKWQFLRRQTSYISYSKKYHYRLSQNPTFPKSHFHKITLFQTSATKISLSQK